MTKILPENIKTLSSLIEFKLKEKGSLFHAISIPMESEESAGQFLNKIRKEYYDATHHCYSYKFHDGHFKYSDDGEPSGTAGIRIYNAQIHFNLTDILTVVIRYFGGTKLGVGPLGKAYYDSAIGSIQEEKIVEKILYQQIKIEYDFSLSKAVHYLISKYRIIISESLFNTTPQIIGLIKPSDRPGFEAEAASFDQQKLNCVFIDSFTYLSKSVKN